MKAVLAVLSILSLSAFAADAPKASASNSTEPAINAVIKKNLANILQLGANVEMDISRAPDGNLWEVITPRGLFYVSDNGQFLLYGKMFDISNEAGAINMTEEALAKVRLKGMKKFEDSMIIFPAEKPQYQVTIFTDTSCGYCRQLHSQMQEYNDLGITVRYMAFPRQGTTGGTYEQLRAIWCADDKQKAMTDAKAGERLDTAKNQQCTAPIADQYAMGMKVGVSGTPAIVLEDGTMIPGYQGPAQLLQTLLAAK